ncbi:hypothetical protein WEI85_00680 [Actinomycetes bacterium KLBMP 9797]
MTTIAISTSGQPTPTVTPPRRDGHPADFCYVTVSLSGRLSVIDAPDGGAGLFPLGRRNTTGRVYRVDLGGDIVCWLDGDHIGRTVNPIATRICEALSIEELPAWWNRRFAFGQVIFTGASATGVPAGLSDEQLARIVDEHAHANEHTDALDWHR